MYNMFQGLPRVALLPAVYDPNLNRICLQQGPTVTRPGPKPEAGQL